MGYGGGVNPTIAEAARAHEASPSTGLRPAWRIRVDDYEYKAYWTWEATMAAVVEYLRPDSPAIALANACGRHYSVRVTSCWAVDDDGEPVVVAISGRLHAVMMQGTDGPMVSAAFADGSVVVG